MQLKSRIYTSTRRLTIGLLLTAMAACGVDKAESEQQAADIAYRDSLLNQMAISFQEIEDNLSTIKQRQGVLEESDTEDRLDEDQRSKIIRDIQLMNTLLEESRSEIEELTAKLENSGVESEKIKRRMREYEKDLSDQESEMASLKKSLQFKNYKIQELNTYLDSMQIKMALNEIALEEQQELLANKETELNTAFYTCGTYKELETQGIVEKEGGVLGLGRTKSLEQNFKEKYFTKIDTRETTRIPLIAKKANLITAHPTNSYKMITNKETGMITYIEIINPSEFWKANKYMVVETKS